MSVAKAVILTAGYGTRFLPATKAVPKALLPLVDRPAIQYLVEEAVAAGIREIVIVTNPRVTAIRDYFAPSPELERFLEQRGDSALLDEVRRIPQMADIAFVEQERPLGIADAVLATQPLVGNQPFVLFFADDIIDSEAPAAGQLIEVFERYGASVVAVERVPREEIPGYGIVEVRPVADRVFEVLRLVEKPSLAEAPSDLGIVGRYVLTPEIFAVIPHTAPGAGGELQITDALAVLRRQRPIYACQFQGRRYDTGRPLGMLIASLEMGLKRSDMGQALADYLRRLKLLQRLEAAQ